ncbi:hypothetical protein TAMA11512_13000 [Selenomonas sp. TAMA-11512]|uniref:rolling circle replication-associated protein n=1 Tax=Selenomonas sp. TAMA-11512 TaxID=3095337 RepID=UPI00308C1616|nr:hypothetical protein TAMA11512_13000 [Selenomonas sp. TAMA-11512]
MGKTTERQEEINRKRRAENLMMLLADNFKNGDWYLTLTYRETPDREKVQKDFEKFKRNMRDWLKRRNIPFRYIGIVENLSGRGRPHCHILIPAVLEYAQLINRVEDIWPHGRVKAEPYRGGALDAKKMSDYFTKEKVEKRAGGVQTSKNLLRRPPTKKKITRAQTYKDEIKAPRGYRVIRELSYNAYTTEGYPIQVAYFEKMRC